MKKQLLFNFTRFLFREMPFKMAAFAVLTLLTAQSSFAQSVTWTGGVGGTNSDFLTGTNWSSTPLFNNTSNFTIASGPSSQPVLSSNYPTANSGTVTINPSATLTTNANISTSTSTNPVNGTLNVNAGTYTSRIYVSNASGSNGVVNVAAGAFLTGSGTPWRIGAHASATGATVNVNGTLTIATPALSVGNDCSGVLNINSGGLATISSTSNIGLSTAAAQGTVNVNGGTLTLGTAGSLAVGGTVGTGVININSGTVNVNYTAFASLTINSTGSIKIDNGSLVINNTTDPTAAVNTFISANKIVAASGKSLSISTFDGTKTIVTAVAPTWNGSAWSNGTPSSTLEAVIDGTYSTTTSGGFTAYKLTVNAGKSMTINSGTNVTVQNQVINNGSLVVENNANLVQVNNTTNTGNVVVNRNSNALHRLDYTMWSSPVASQNLAAFSPLTSQSPSRFYTYDPVSNTYLNIATPTSATFSAATGYLIRMPNTDLTSGYDAGSATLAYPGVFTGVPNNGTVNLTSLTSSAYYAVGNPYPSTISADAFMNGNSTAGTLYFWRKTNGAGGTAYATYTLAGGVGAPGNGGITPNGTIQVGQGFIVKTGAAATSLSFTNAMRTSNNANQILKIKPTAEKSRLWLNLTTATEGINQMMVAYMDGATTDVDEAIDGKYINDAPTALTSNINDEEYIIQGRGLPFEDTDVVPLAFKAKAGGTYTISLDHVDGLFSDKQDIYLKDNVTGKEQDVKKGAYTFESEAGTFNDRFQITYNKSGKSIADDNAVVDDNTIVVYKQNQTIIIQSGSAVIAEVKVYDLNGRLIAHKKNVGSNETSIVVKPSYGVYVVKVTTTDGTVVTKKIIQ